MYLSGCMLLWGIVSGATAGVQTYGGLIAVRFLLGFVEAVYFVSTYLHPTGGGEIQTDQING